MQMLYTIAEACQELLENKLNKLLPKISAYNLL